jgi:hypothetical protein
MLSTQRLRIAAALVVVSALTFQLGAAPAFAGSKRPLGAATPEALVERLNAATAKEDLGETLACLAPDDRSQLVAALLVGATMIGAFMQMGGDMAAGLAEGMAEGLSGGELTAEQKAQAEKAKKEASAQAAAWQKKYETMLRKHNLEEMIGADAELPSGEGAAALHTLFKDTDEIALAEDLIGLLKESGQGEMQENATPPGVPAEKITGLKVEGDRATAQAGQETVELAKIDGRWYAKAPEKTGETPPQ